MTKLMEIFIQRWETIKHQIEKIDIFKGGGILRNRKFYYLSWGIAILLSGILFCFMIEAQEFIDDDHFYKLVFGTDQEVQSLSDILLSQWRHYFNQGGRNVVHTIAQILIFIGKPWCSIINAITIVLFSLTMCKLVSGKKKIRLSNYIVCISLIYLINPAMNSTLIWITGTSNYLWGFFLITLCILPYRLYLDSNRINQKYNVTKSLCFFIATILAGWTNENTSAAFIAYIFVWFFICISKNYKITTWSVTGFFGAIIGWVTMIAAPGNYVRADMIADENKYSLFETLIVRGYYMERAFFDYLFYAIILIIISVLMIKYLLRLKININASLFLFFAIIAYLTMILSPTFPPRVAFGIMGALIIASIILINQACEHSVKLNNCYRLISVFCFAAFVMQSFSSILYGVLK